MSLRLSHAFRRRAQRPGPAGDTRSGSQPKSLRFERLEVRQLLTAVAWTGAIDNNWDVAGNWSTGAVPTSTADVTIGASGAATVIIRAGDVESIESLVVDPGSTLAISGGSLTTGAGLSNSGAISVAAGCNLTVAGDFSQSTTGTLSMPGGGSTANPTSNLALNPDFESPVAGSGTTEPSSWAYWGTTVLSKQYAYSGTQSLEMSGAASAGAVESVAVAPGTSYTLSVNAMTPAGNPLTGNMSAEVELLYYDSSGTQISSYSAPNLIGVLNDLSPTGGPLTGSVGGQGWNHFNTSAVAPSNAATAHVIVTTYLSSGAGAGRSIGTTCSLGRPSRARRISLPTPFPTAAASRSAQRIRLPPRRRPV